MTTIISEKGQITIPKKLRDHLGLAPGVVIDFEISEGKLVGKKVSKQNSLLRWIGKGKMPDGKKRAASTESYLKSIRGK
ncbi:MAG: AbrB/MazE/SpoVT family DNA-binding domain-containing protein [Verrucomicrobiales bacterium]|nr:AbrB/MazE/SpoVT family DNA-binding domain-containing protein [Verrucomicrobiales bacterium]